MTRASGTVTPSSQSLRNHFLLAMPGIEGGIFAHSVTYICEHGEAGAMGIVINHELDLNLEEIFEHLEIATELDFSATPVLAGGPVQTDHGFILHKPCATDWDASLQVTEGMMLTTSQDILRAIAAGSGPEEYLIALGYAGWSAGQLEEEIIRNSWLTLPADPEIIFSEPPAARFKAAGAMLGIDMNLISSEAGHA